jgi:hypothetical protein
MITKLFPTQSNVYAKGPVGENVFHMAMLLNTPSTLAIARYLVKLYGRTLVNTPFQARRPGWAGLGWAGRGWAAARRSWHARGGGTRARPCRRSSPHPQHLRWATGLASPGPGSAVAARASLLLQERRSQHDAPGLYEGQTALHIAVVNRDFDMVKFLVQSGANIRTRAFGTFFNPDGPMYYGEDWAHARAGSAAA